MTVFTTNKRLIVIWLVFAAVVFLAASLYIHTSKREYVLHTQVKIAEQEMNLATIAELTNRDGADAVVAQIIQDCSLQNRERFDMLLGKLAELNVSELREIEQLFDACGNFFSERKAVMVSRFEREYEVYKDLIEILSLAEKNADGILYETEKWGQLVALEKERSMLSTKLVSVQGEIITSLSKGESVVSESMQLRLVEGQQTKERLTELASLIDALRSELLKI